MRRRLLVLLSASVLLALFIPATAAAAGWVVKSPSGQRLGKVVRVSKGVCDLYDAAGVHCGWVQWRSGDSDWMAVWGYDTDGGLRKMATVDKGYKRWYLQSDWELGHSGYAIRKASRWVVRMHADGGIRTMGRVSRYCPGWGATGAVYVLCGDQWL